MKLKIESEEEKEIYSFSHWGKTRPRSTRSRRPRKNINYMIDSKKKYRCQDCGVHFDCHHALAGHRSHNHKSKNNKKNNKDGDDDFLRLKSSEDEDDDDKDETFSLSSRNKRKKRVHKCTHCGKVFPRTQELRDHMKNCKKVRFENSSTKKESKNRIHSSNSNKIVLALRASRCLAEHPFTDSQIPESSNTRSLSQSRKGQLINDSRTKILDKGTHQIHQKVVHFESSSMPKSSGNDENTQSHHKKEIVDLGRSSDDEDENRQPHCEKEPLVNSSVPTRLDNISESSQQPQHKREHLASSSTERRLGNLEKLMRTDKCRQVLLVNSRLCRNNEPQSKMQRLVLPSVRKRQDCEASQSQSNMVQLENTPMANDESAQVQANNKESTHSQCKRKGPATSDDERTQPLYKKVNLGNAGIANMLENSDKNVQSLVNSSVPKHLGSNSESSQAQNQSVQLVNASATMALDNNNQSAHHEIVPLPAPGIPTNFGSGYQNSQSQSRVQLTNSHQGFNNSNVNSQSQSRVQLTDAHLFYQGLNNTVSPQSIHGIVPLAAPGIPTNFGIGYQNSQPQSNRVQLTNARQFHQGFNNSQSLHDFGSGHESSQLTNAQFHHMNLFPMNSSVTQSLAPNSMEYLLSQLRSLNMLIIPSASNASATNTSEARAMSNQQHSLLQEEPNSTPPGFNQPLQPNSG